MRVLFDSSVTDFDRGGTSRYVHALMPRLLALGAPVEEVSMLAAWPWSRALPYSARVLLHDLVWIPAGAAAVGRMRRADLYHGAGFKVPPRAPFATSVTIHDDTPWDRPPTARLYNRVYMRRVLRAAAPHLAGAITSAEVTAEAILSRLPALRGRMHVTPWGVDHEVFRPRPADEVDSALREVGGSRPYALLVGAYGPRKNLPRMLRALAAVRESEPGLSVVLVGRHDPATVDSLPVALAGNVPDDALAALYSGASMLVYSSLKEGFGLPVLEAMACGCPVVTSKGTVLEEIAADAAVAVDPLSVDAIAGACRELLADPGRRTPLVKSGPRRAAYFTWENTAALTMAAWEQMA